MLNQTISPDLKARGETKIEESLCRIELKEIINQESPVTINDKAFFWFQLGFIFS